MKYNSLVSLAISLCVSGSIVPAHASVVNIDVDVRKVEQCVTPWLYGACIEDVNHEIYGGLYAQLIFGESFEEPRANPLFRGFTAYEGAWDMREGHLFGSAHSGAKIVNDSAVVCDGEVAADIRFGNGGESAGLLVRVSHPGNGADSFYGYEIGLSADGRRVIVGKHKNNFTHIKDVAVNCNPCEWNNLKAVMRGEHVDVLLNGVHVYGFDDSDSDLANGSVALRVWNADTDFRNFTVSAGGEICELPFDTLSVPEVSRHWDCFHSEGVDVRCSQEGEDAFHGKKAQAIKFVSGTGRAGLANAGLNRWGISVERGQKFNGRVYLKSPDYRGKVRVALESIDGSKTYACDDLTGIDVGWRMFPFTLESVGNDRKARFTVSIDGPGKIMVDMVTLMPDDDKLFHGLPMRRDIATAMQQEGLTFLRYGGTMVNAPEYRFKKMIGDPDHRPPYHGHWNRWSTNGFGIEEFMKLCETAGFTAAFAINIEESPEDVADMIEYLNGAIDTEWGAIRARNGHPEPYGLKYIGIGNEEVLFHGDRADEYDHYVERFNLLYDAIKSKDPSVKLVNTAWWRPDSPNIEKVFRALDGKADYWDYHPWADALSTGREVEAELRRMKEMFLTWNPETSMKCAIFEENGVTHNVQRMLGHVLLQNAVRRMGDFVLTSCAANALQPYLQNDNGWDQGQVFFTQDQVWGMPPYYAQQMASAAHQSLLVSSQTDDTTGCLDVTATRSADGHTVVLHAVNITGDTVDAKLDIDGLGKISMAKAVSLSGNLDDRNTPEEPEAIVPVMRILENVSSQIVSLPPYSYTIVTFSE